MAPPCVDRACILKAREGPWLRGINRDYIEVSFVFSSIGTEHHAGNVLLSGCDRSARGLGRILHSAAFEILPRARDALVDILDGPVFGDICELLPTAIRKWATSGSRSFGILKRTILNQQVPLASTSFCHRSGKPMPAVRLGDISFAGIPCVDYSPMGLRKQTRGPTGLLVLVWARMIQVHRPRFIVIEEVPQFEKHGLTVLMSGGVLGNLYDFLHGIVNPRSLGLPVSRPRLYVIGVLRGFAAIEGSVKDLTQLVFNHEGV